LETAYVIGNGRIPGLKYLAIGILLVALMLEAIDHHENSKIKSRFR
jgi:hypothetical protein